MYCDYKILNVKLRPILEAQPAFPTMPLPQPFGHYSITPAPGRHFEKSKAQLRYIVEPLAGLLPLSLNGKVDESLTTRDYALDEYLDHLLYFIEMHKSMFLELKAGVWQLNADVVCSREVLQLMMCAPYEIRNNWTLAVTKYRNTMYICRVDNSVPGAAPDYSPAHLERIMNEAWEHRMRRSCLQSRDGQVTEEHGEFNCVFRTEINGLRLIFDAPMLAEFQSIYHPDAPETFAALKLRLDQMNGAQWKAHNRSEAVKWWAECYLVNIKNVYIALRDEEGIVHKFEKKTPREIWKECEKDWSASACATCMVRLLDAIRKVMAPVNCPSTVYLFEFKGQSGTITYRVAEGRNVNTFLPDWFRTMMDEQLDK